MWTKENIPSQAGKIVIVTGANSGIGYETALALYDAGAHVIVACRSQKKAETAMAKMKNYKPTGSLEAGVLELSDLDSVKKFAEDFKQKYEKLDLLINNAGILLPPASVTAQGYELQFGVNFLAHFALTGHLYEILKNTPGARVVNISSLAYESVQVIDFDNLKSEKSYDGFREYSISKLANLQFTVELQKRINAAGDKILSVAAHPGTSKTNSSRYMTQEAIDSFGEIMPAPQGALPTLRAAVDLEVVGATFYGPDGGNRLEGYPAVIPMNSFATDANACKKLWQAGEKITGLVFP